MPYLFLSVTSPMDTISVYTLFGIGYKILFCVNGIRAGNYSVTLENKEKKRKKAETRTSLHYKLNHK